MDEQLNAKKSVSGGGANAGGGAAVAGGGVGTSK